MNYGIAAKYPSQASEAFYKIAQCYAALDQLHEALKNLELGFQLDPHKTHHKMLEDPLFNKIKQSEDFQNLLGE